MIIKKTIFLFVALLLGMTAAAQTWTKEHRKADPVRELPERNVYTYQIDSITYFEICDATIEWRLVKKMENDGFKFKIGKFQSNLGEVRVKIDACLLDPQKNVIGGVYHNIQVTATYKARAIGSGKYTKGEDIPRHLLNGVGYVRIIAPLYYGGEVDVTIPCIHG